MEVPEAMDSSIPGTEKRRHTRTSIELPVVVQGMSPHSQIRGHCLDLSEAGAGGILTGVLKPGQVVLMELVLAADCPVQVNARVRHVSRLHCGFEFLAPDHEVVGHIRAACQSVQ